MQSKLTLYKLTITLCFLTIATYGYTQPSSKSIINNTDTSINHRVYEQSVELNDFNTAIYAVHYLIAGDPVKYANWQDTLALLYMQINAFQQAYILSDALLTNRGYTSLRMEIKAVSAKGLQQPIQAIDAYTTLFTKTHNPVYGFEEMQLQYAIRRLAETVATGNSLLQSIPANDSTRVNVLKLDGKTPQQVTLRAATANVLGLAFIDLKDKTNAVAQFEVALKENPDFEQAKNNMNVAKSLGSSDEKK